MDGLEYFPTDTISLKSVKIHLNHLEGWTGLKINRWILYDPVNWIQLSPHIYWNFQYFIPAAEAEAAAKSRAVQWLLLRPVWKALLSQLDCLHELRAHHCPHSGPWQRNRPLEVHHRTCQQQQGQRNSSRMVSLITYKVLTPIFALLSVPYMTHVSFYMNCITSVDIWTESLPWVADRKIGPTHKSGLWSIP